MDIEGFFKLFNMKEGDTAKHALLVRTLNDRLFRSSGELVVVRYPRDGERVAFGFVSGHPIRLNHGAKSATIPTIGRLHYSFDVVTHTVAEQDESFIPLGNLILMPVRVVWTHVHIGFEGAAHAVSRLSDMSDADTGAIVDFIPVGTSGVEKSPNVFHEAKRIADLRRQADIATQIEVLCAHLSRT
jgi:hypothetical protein